MTRQKKRVNEEDPTLRLYQQFAINADPVNFWQLSQWQTKNFSGSPVSIYCTAPQRQEPGLVWGIWVVWSFDCAEDDK